ncbi:hypothetical protein PENSPDRAFT_371295 [Peniophora sp. CONT]|nr:hypothetical protein PENSPDRAFT_371295 [Peniophora sp. CONT]
MGTSRTGGRSLMPQASVRTTRTLPHYPFSPLVPPSLDVSMTHYTHKAPYNGSGLGYYDKNMLGPDSFKKSSSSGSKRVKKSKRETRSPTVESFKGYHPYGLHPQPVATTHRSSFSPRTQPLDPLSFSPQIPTASLPSSSSPPPRVRQVSQHPSPVPAQKSPGSPMRVLLHAIDDYTGATTYVHERHRSPEHLSRSSSYSSESFRSRSSRSSSPNSVASTPPLSPYSTSSHFSVSSSSRSSSRHASPELMDYCATYAAEKPVMHEYDYFLGRYHENVNRSMHHRRH